MGLIKATIGIILIGFGVSTLARTLVDIARKATNLVPRDGLVPTVPADATEEWKAYLPPVRED